MLQHFITCFSSLLYVEKGQTIIEYPTIIIGTKGGTKRIPLYVKDNEEALGSGGDGDEMMIDDNDDNDDGSSSSSSSSSSSDDIDDGDDGDDDGDDINQVEFLNTLKELEGKDTSTLKEMIS